ncbi:hypothetical protein C8F04DRAFT_1125090 [Mycena alexandri]|uniref:DUF6534 domain-containing protein n=1 Tax=Mycena alexandri TaxID=1745969 RepID=A0AAD6SGV7_9AGAR|nr:hypothetical protein C8F04DRAFT_1125090 [Mycena alexandri]
MATAPVSLDLNLQSTYGVLLIGCFLSAAVWGVSFVQTFLYFMMYERDSIKLKLLVLFLIAVDTANEILVLRSVWPALILHWGRVDILGKSEGTIELIHHVWVAAIVAAGVQSYYTWRIYTLSGRKRLLPCILIPLIAWQIIGLGPYNFLALGHAAVSAGKQTQQLTAVAISLRAAGAATDIVITAAMLYLLSKPEAQFTSTKRLVFRLLVLSINSGTWTAILAVLDFISILAFPIDFTFCIFELPICSLYLSTLLVNLNARKFLTNNNESMDLRDLSDRNQNVSSVLESIHFVQRTPDASSLGTTAAYLSQGSGSTGDLKKIVTSSEKDGGLRSDGAV